MRMLQAILYVPTVAYLIALTIFPLIYSLYISLFDYTLTGGGAKFVGLGNYAFLLKDPDFWISALNTLIIVASTVSIELVLGMVIAILLNRRWKGFGLFQLLIFIPMMLSPLVLGYFWKFMYDSQFGIINWFLSLVGTGPVSWLTSRALALPSIILVDVWQWTPFMVLIILAGLQTVPVEEYEAASLDRASSWLQFRKITLPYLKPSILLATLLRTIDSFRMFDLVYILTGGGPGNSTQTLSLAAYKYGYQFFQIGKAAALSWVMVIIVNIIVTILMKVIKGKPQSQKAIS
ncbi:MAG: sugar ABC transporter permease [Firmicutes bacterium]|nr:sugar ABC transporter permease [Bacillota bacterium]